MSPRGTRLGRLRIMSGTLRLRPAEFAIKIAAPELSDPIVRRRPADLEEKHDPRGWIIERPRSQPGEVSAKRSENGPGPV
ncbi:hypothetical protein mvi_65180 (plasmid) [Methylobacterium indicum]|uniref:Uncharacterized protein n=1 Tax=Methylobacterium indicum TaxID=1775910 RepID=A0A8H8X1A7_9HYPH|nr:hypothetical protein mvi_65180 [Methylobacterium indicum]